MLMHSFQLGVLAQCRDSAASGTGPSVMFIALHATQSNGAPWTKSATAQMVSTLQDALLQHSLPAKVGKPMNASHARDILIICFLQVIGVSESRLLVTMEGRDQAEAIKNVLLEQAGVASIEWERKQYYPQQKQEQRPNQPVHPARGGPAWRHQQLQKAREEAAARSRGDEL
jgi:hypothetical protein